MERANNPPLEQAPEVINVSGMHVVPDVFTLAVSDTFVGVSVRFQRIIAGVLISSDKTSLLGNDFSHKTGERFAIRVLYDLGNDFSATLNCANDGDLTRSASPFSPFALVAVLILPTNVRLVNFDFTEQLTKAVLFHRGTNPVTHVPCSFIRARAQHTVNLVGAHPLLALEHQEDDLEPITQGVLGVLKDGAANNGEAIAVLVALLANPMEWTSFQCPHFGVAALGTRHTVRPPLGDQVFFAGFFRVKLHQQFVNLHGNDYSVYLSWCQLADNRLLSEAGAIFLLPCFRPSFALWTIVQCARFFWILFTPPNFSFSGFFGMSPCVCSIFFLNTLLTPRSQPVLTSCIFIEKVQRRRKKQHALCAGLYQSLGFRPAFLFSVRFHAGEWQVGLGQTLGWGVLGIHCLPHLIQVRRTSFTRTIIRQLDYGFKRRALEKSRQKSERIRLVCGGIQLELATENHGLHVKNIAKTAPHLKRRFVSVGLSTFNGELRLRFCSPMIGRVPLGTMHPSRIAG